MFSGMEWEPIREWLLSTGLQILLVLILAWVAARVLKVGINRFRDIQKELQPEPDVTQRVDTLSGILYRVVVIAIVIVAVLVVLSQLGIKLGPVIAAAGIGGLAIGFGAQTLVKDVISGFFILMEDQVRVGDVVQVDGQGGLVEAVRLRYLRLRDLSGVVHYIPNGSIGKISNMTRGFSYYVVDMGVAYREDVDEVMEIMKRTVEEMRAEEPWNLDILEPLDVLGLDKFADSAVVIRARIKTRPIRQWAAGREFNRRIKKALDDAGVEIPFPHRTVYWGESKDGTPATLHLAQVERSGSGPES
jgi:small conductance mechanosensitive channel